MKHYLITLLNEKGKSTDDTIAIDGHIGLTYSMLFDFIDTTPIGIQSQIKDTLVRIDFKNGDIFHYLNHLALGMIAVHEH